MIRQWFKKPPVLCTEEDACFLFLLCCGRRPVDGDEMAPIIGAGFFASLKKMLGHPEMRQLVLGHITLGKQPPHCRLTEEDLTVVRQGLVGHLRQPVPPSGLDWRSLLVMATKSERYQKAFLSHYSADRLGAFQTGLDALSTNALPTGALSTNAPASIVGRISDTADQECTGLVVDLQEPDSALTLDFYLNGLYVGTSRADQQAHQWAADFGGNAPWLFTHRLVIPEALMGQDRLTVSVFDHKSGTPIAPAREVIVNSLSMVDRVHALTSELAMIRKGLLPTDTLATKLDEVTGLLPRLEQLGTFPTSAYEAYRDAFPIEAPSLPEGKSLPGETTATFAVLVLNTGTDAALEATDRSLELQSYPPADTVVLEAEDRLQDAINRTSASHILILAAGDTLDPHALAWLANAVNRHPAATVYFGDYDETDTGGKQSPVFQYPLDPDLLLQRNYVNRAFAVSTSWLRRQTVISAATDPHLHHELLLLALETEGAEGFQQTHKALWHVPQPIVQHPGTDLIAAHLARRGLEAVVTEHGDPIGSPVADAVSLRWKPDPSLPKLAIIVPTKDRRELIEPCVQSLLETMTYPDQTEIIILDNGSTDTETLAYFESIKSHPNIRLLEAPGPFNWSRLNNTGAQAADAAYLLFLNDDTLALTKGWDEVLRGHLARSHIGIVGARLLYRNGTLQHAGMVFYGPDQAHHEGAEKACDAPHPLFRTRLAHACAAVTGAFLACRRDVFLKVEGFEEALAVTNNDVDFCFKVRAANLTVLYEPQILFRHYQSESRGQETDHTSAERQQSERAFMIKKWSGLSPLDPYYPDGYARQGKPFSRLANPGADATNHS